MIVAATQSSAGADFVDCFKKSTSTLLRVPGFIHRVISIFSRGSPSRSLIRCTCFLSHRSCLKFSSVIKLSC